MSQTPDGEAAEELAAGKRQKAMRHVHEEQHPRLLRYVARRVASREEARDVCQEIWRVFFVKFDVFVEQYEDLAMVLYPIARCRIADFWQQRGRRQEDLFEDEDPAMLASAVQLGMEQFEVVDRRVDLERAVACLPPRQREALSLHYVDKLTVSQAAVLMGISNSGVKKLLKKALSKLRTTTSLNAYRPAMPQEGRK